MTWRDWVDPRQAGWGRLLLLAAPVALGLWLAGAPAIWQFLVSGLAIVPLAGLMGEATEQLARRFGPAIGGLLNATFGNAAELIIALFALFRGLDDVVKASLTGSLIGNLLLVLGASFLAGGVKFSIQRFNRTAAAAGGTLAVLAAVGLVVPAIFHYLVSAQRLGRAPEGFLEHKLSVGVCALLLVSYMLNLIFSLGTHRDLFNPRARDQNPDGHSDGRQAGARQAMLVLAVATAAVALMSEVLVGTVEQASRALGLTEVFVGVVVVAVVGNAAEHWTAVLMARKNQMDLAVGIAVGSALQIALLVAPVLVFASYLRPHPMDLVFTTLEVVAVILAVLIARLVAEDGESNWLEGAMLLMVYAILSVAFYYLPPQHHRSPGAQPPGASAPQPASAAHAGAHP